MSKGRQWGSEMSVQVVSLRQGVGMVRVRLVHLGENSMSKVGIGDRVRVRERGPDGNGI